MNITILCNAHSWGGGERSIAYISQLLMESGHDVTIKPTQGFKKEFKIPQGVKLVQSFILNPQIPVGECDVLLIYANEILHYTASTRAQWDYILSGKYRKICCINHEIGKGHEDWFVSKIDKFLFLSSSRRLQFLNAISLEGKETKVLAPAVDLEPFLKITPNYKENLRFIRITNQRFKWDMEDTLETFKALSLRHPEAYFLFMGTPQPIRNQFWDNDRFHMLRNFEVPNYQFLRMGNLFHYMTPAKYEDQGPRVIVEAMASAIPVVAQKRGGAADRITEKTGWFVKDQNDLLNTVLHISPKVLEEKGQAARKRAVRYFDARKWVEQITE